MEKRNKIIIAIIAILVLIGIVCIFIIIKNKMQEKNVPTDSGNINYQNSVEPTPTPVLTVSEKVKKEELLPNEFDAIVKEIRGNSIIVTPKDDALELEFSDEIELMIIGKEIDKDIFQEGDNVKVKYSKGITITNGYYKIWDLEDIQKLDENNEIEELQIENN